MELTHPITAPNGGSARVSQERGQSQKAVNERSYLLDPRYRAFLD